MASVIVVTCPECDKQIKARPESEGKKVRCTACGHVFVAKAAGQTKPKKDDAVDVVPLEKEPAPPKKPKAPAKPVKRPTGAEKEDKPYGLETVELALRCPYCAHKLEDEAVICLNCGYNVQTRERTKVKRMYENTPMDWVLWLMPGILCVLAILLLLAFDIWFCTGFDSAIEGLLDGWVSFILAGGVSKKIWPLIVSVFLMYYAGRFAVRRLIFNPRPPERFKTGGAG